MILLAAEGVANQEIAERLGAGRTTVIRWRDRYAERGLSGLDDRERSGRPRELDHRAIVTETLKPPPKKFGVTHWSSRLLGQQLKISNTSVAREWKAYGIKPWKAESFAPGCGTTTLFAALDLTRATGVCQLGSMWRA